MIFASSPGSRPGRWRSARRLRATPLYIGAVLASGFGLSMTDPATRDRILRACSTNVENLARGRWWTLLTSSVVVSHLYAAGSLPMAIVLAEAELRWGWPRLLAVFWYGHVLATLIVYAVLRRSLDRGWVHPDVASAHDVGISYGWVATLGALIMGLPRPQSGLYAAAGVTTFGLALARRRTFTDLGHLAALLLGLLAGVALRPALSPSMTESHWA